MSDPIIRLTPELRKAITQVYDDGQQNWDRSDGLPDDDSEVGKQYKLVRELTEHVPPADNSYMAAFVKANYPGAMEALQGLQSLGLTPLPPDELQEQLEQTAKINACQHPRVPLVKSYYSDEMVQRGACPDCHVILLELD